MIASRIRAFFGRATAPALPLDVVEFTHLNEGIVALFRKSFRAEPPDYPIHIAAVARDTGDVVGYIHYTTHAPGVFRLGGLCVDTRIYRRLSDGDRRFLKAQGSLSRWLLNESIRKLPAKRAIFAYTGNVMSLRDGFESGFEKTAHPHLIVQWHAAEPRLRPELIRGVADFGPF
jgi:hypothetical protein